MIFESCYGRIFLLRTGLNDHGSRDEIAIGCCGGWNAVFGRARKLYGAGHSRVQWTERSQRGMSLYTRDIANHEQGTIGFARRTGGAGGCQTGSFEWKTRTACRIDVWRADG